MKSTFGVVAVVMLIAGVGALSGTAAETVRGFGFGGGMAAAFFPDLSEVNVFLSENGLDPFDDFLIGGGGLGRGGMIGGPVAGGIGWGVVATSEKENRHAELVFGGGGVDFGCAIGGDDRSVLTIGCVFGGGATLLSFSVGGSAPLSWAPAGIVPEPAERTIGRAGGFVQPYVSLEAQLLSWVGLELRVGYVLPVFGIPFGDLMGIPVPSLSLSGPMVSVGLVFGGIGVSAPDDGLEPGTTSQVGGSFALPEGAELRIENATGDVVVLSRPTVDTETGSGPIVEWTAALGSRPRRLPGLDVAVESMSNGIALRTTGTGRVDYEVRVPAGTSLSVKNGVGDVRISSHEAESIVVDNGVGDIDLYEVRSAALVVAGGLGDVTLVDAEAVALTAHLGIGKITLEHRVGAPATIVARVGFGDIFYASFPEMTGGFDGGFGKAGKLVLAGGGPLFDLSVGVGSIEVGALQP